MANANGGTAVWPLCLSIIVFATGIAVAGCARASSERARLFRAAKTGDIHAMRETLRTSPILVNARDEAGATPLHYVPDTTSARLLLRAGANIAARDAEGMPPLSTASRRGDTEVVRTLLSHGAEVNARDTDGFTALHYAAMFGRLATCKALLEGGADVHARGTQSITPLRLAEENGRQDVVGYLRRVAGNHHH